MRKCSKTSEPVFVDLLRSPEIDSQHGGPVRQPYLSYRPAKLYRLAESVHRNRFLGSINVNKYELWDAIASSYSFSILKFTFEGGSGCWGGGGVRGEDCISLFAVFKDTQCVQASCSQSVDQTNTLTWEVQIRHNIKSLSFVMKHSSDISPTLSMGLWFQFGPVS
jgi:hypothetical protein